MNYLHKLQASTKITTNI